MLDEWLRKRALQNSVLGATRTYVVCAPGPPQVIGYHSLCMGQILGVDTAGSMRRNMPVHIPAVILARLTVDKRWQGSGLGRHLLGDAVDRSLRAAAEVSARLMVVHAISPAAETFYQHHGFSRLPVASPTYALDLVKLMAVGQQ